MRAKVYLDFLFETSYKRIIIPPHFSTAVYTSLGQRGEEQFPILVVTGDVFPPVAAIHDVVNRAGILNA